MNFPIEAEYATLEQVLAGCNGESVVLIHSKPVRGEPRSGLTLVDATGHSLTPKEEILRRIGDTDSLSVEDPSDIQEFLIHLRKTRKSLPETRYWVWWSPSDLVAQGVQDSEIVRCLRVIAKEFASSHFIALAAKNVHSDQGQALLEYVSEGVVDVTKDWSVVKHPTLLQEMIADVF